MSLVFFCRDEVSYFATLFDSRMCRWAMIHFLKLLGSDFLSLTNQSIYDVNDWTQQRVPSFMRMAHKLHFKQGHLVLYYAPLSS